MRNRIGLFLFVVTCAASCSLPQRIQLQDVQPLPDSFAVKTPDTSTIANISWKTFFTDPYLVALIDSAIHNNPDLNIALQRVEMASAQLGIRKAAFYPSVSAVATASGDHYGDYTMTGVGNFDTNLSPNIKEEQKVARGITPEYFLGLRSSWEIDVWGKLKQQKKAAQARLLSMEMGRQYVITNLVAAVGSLYYQLLASDYELQIVKKNIVLQQEALEVVRMQKEGGRATELAVQQFNAQLLNTKAIEYSIRQQIIEVENRLNEITGRYTGPIARDSAIMQQPLPVNLQSGLPAGLVVRRPDIRQAELEIEAARADLEAVRKTFLPALNLSPYIGFNAFKSDLLFNPGSLVYGAMAGLAAPVINRRALRGEHRIAGAQAREAVSQYRKVLLSSYNEVLTTLKSIENASASFDLKSEEVSELRNAVSTARDLYLAGYANYLEVISAQKGVLEAELQLTENKKELFQKTISLYRSLGGGWN